MVVIGIRVEARPDGSGEGKMPVSFTIGSRILLVVEVMDRWQGERQEYFKLRADDGCTYIIRYDRLVDEWDLTMMDRG